MRYWATSFPLSSAVTSFLNDTGLQPWSEGVDAIPSADALLLYDTPDSLISMAVTGVDAGELTARSLLEGYRRLLAWSEQRGLPLLAISQFQQMGPKGVRAWLLDGVASFSSPAPPMSIPPLLASVTLSLLDAEPELLDSYYDLELRAELLGRDPDLRYGERLRNVGQESTALLQAFLTSERVLVDAHDLEQRMVGLETELQVAREQAEYSDMQHRQVQMELEHCSLIACEKSRLLEAEQRDLEGMRLNINALNTAHEQELIALRQHLDTRSAELEQGLFSKDLQIQKAREDVELSLLQLHHVQEELDDYSLQVGDKQRQLEAVERKLEHLQSSKTAQESCHELELQSLRNGFERTLIELEQRLASKDTELNDVRDVAELAELQLQQVQEELEHIFLAHGDKQRQLEAGKRELEQLQWSKAAQESAHELELHALRERFEPRLAELEQRLASKDRALQDARDVADLTELQLQQVEEELQYHFLKARATDQLVHAQFEQLQRTQHLIARLHPTAIPTPSYPPVLSVQVLPKVADAMTQPTLETDALLSTYAASLQRASALLERFRRL
jgi:hypothetical protein